MLFSLMGLLLAYSSNHLAMFLLCMAKGLPVANILNAPFVAAEVLNILGEASAWSPWYRWPHWPPPCVTGSVETMTGMSTPPVH